MARTTKQLSGTSKDRVLRALIAEEPELAAEPAQRLADRLCHSISDVRVKREVLDALPRAGKRQKASDGAELPELPGAIGVQSRELAAAAFDPFAFSDLAVLTRGGRVALEARLAEIHQPEHLIALAVAQHLGIDRGLSDAAALRAAIAAATERRLAERRAAAG